jgi:hypothetical protein
MDVKLAKHLWRSPAVRSGFRKEAIRFLVFVGVYISVAVGMRYFREKPFQETVWSATFAMAGFVLAWLICAIRTVRAVLRQEKLLDR